MFLAANGILIFAFYIMYLAGFWWGVFAGSFLGFGLLNMTSPLLTLLPPSDKYLLHAVSGTLKTVFDPSRLESHDLTSRPKTSRDKSNVSAALD
jgi:hypothetical protein